MFENLFNYLLEENSFGDTIKSTENGYLIKLYVPGYGKEDFNIEMEGNLLSIKAEGFKTKKYELPDNIKSVSAKCDKGILELELFRSKRDRKTIKVS